ncbi:hypothetical protein LPC08_04375 [Roseomonas sp. OT10]|uniref:hypothetical protein n=1 Tax=Roseomonas cutis TaxID=2897332 RepID=UPI001E39D22C|nr:hypothetical protein [Roseomonas sp. OT10]UFN49885.1 hypothetical protein LPC08_04375 [Roseomonas sp. OT10]
MFRFALLLVVLGFGTILTLTARLLGGLATQQLDALPIALSALAACSMLVGGLGLLERRAHGQRARFLVG